MSKLSYEEKVKLYYEKKKGVTIPTLVSKYGITKLNIWYLIYLVDKHGLEILKNKNLKSHIFKFLVIISIVMLQFF